DNIDTSVTVVVSGSVDTSTAGTYIIHYNATDLAGNSATEVTRTIIVSAPNGGGGNPPQATFSTPKAVAYLESTQSSDGSFGGNTRYTDWASIALASNGINNSVKTKILDYLKANNNIDSILTSNERRSMALLALGQNPYSFEGINYIKSITDTFDGTQLGDTNLDNDDIFGLMVLPKVGYTINDDEVSKTISFVLSAQLSNGSWDNSVDMTGASIQALAQFDSVDGVKDALNKASNYLQNDIKDGQQSDGGWSNVSSTSWAMQAQAALGVSWNKNGKTGLDYLATTQLSDGGVLPITETLENRIWATSYAIPGALGKNWANIMQSVVKPEITSSGHDNKKTEEEIKKEDEVKKTEEIKKEETVKPLVIDIPKTEPKKKIVQNTIQKQDEKKDEIVDPSTIIASATDSKTEIPTPYILGGTTILLGIGLFLRFYNLPK
ncbi:DUF5011 domain-containing protein, partial [Candidatus Nomurabacteria bacterium]|nr:DUF5011 domain-containing protein [Candidatus Nomurabacteria bacterium]